MQQQVMHDARAELEAARSTYPDAPSTQRAEGRVQGQREMLAILAVALGFSGDDWYQRLQEWADDETAQYIRGRSDHVQTR